MELSVTQVEFERELLGRASATGDDRLIVDWEEAKRRGEENIFAIPDFINAYRGLRYWINRAKADAETRRAQQRRFRRERALEEGAKPAITVGRALAAERARASMTQEQLARATGVPRDIIAKTERDARRMTLHEAFRLADALGVPLDRFRPA